MQEVRFMISDTAKQVEVEAHVLRYWEEELELPIARNEMGHRYYTQSNICLFKNIKELKEQGFQLKAIKMLLPDLENQDLSAIEDILNLRDELNHHVLQEGMEERNFVAGAKEEAEEKSNQMMASKESFSEFVEVENDKMKQFEEILGNIIRQAMKENNELLSKDLGNQVGEQVIKEMDYLLRTGEEREEERFKRLDETIRSLQKTRKQVAASKIEEKKEKRGFRLFKKKRTRSNIIEQE